VILVAAAIAVATALGVAYGRRNGDAAQSHARRILRTMLYVLVPPVVFFNIARLELDADVGIGIGLGWIALTVSGAIAYFVARGLGLPRPSAGVLTNVALQGNTGYLGLPLAVTVLGSEHLPEAIAFDALAQGPVLFLGVFGVGAALGTEAGEGFRERARAFFVRNPPLWAVVAGLLAPHALAPDAAVDASRILLYALLPLGFLAVGITLAGEHVAARFDRRIGAALLLRMVVPPLLLFALAAPLIDIPDAYLLLAATPAGINGLVVAHAYGLDLDLAAGAIAWTTGVFLAVALVAVAII
jgi:predicted permease